MINRSKLKSLNSSLLTPPETPPKSPRKTESPSFTKDAMEIEKDSVTQKKIINCEKDSKNNNNIVTRCETTETTKSKFLPKKHEVNYTFLTFSFCI